MNAADQALQNDPSNPEVLLFKAQALTEGQIDFDQAQRLLKRYISIVGNEKVMNQVLSPVFTARSEDGDSHYFLAQLYHMLGNPEEALREVNRALELGLSGSDHFPEARAQQLKAELLEAEGEREEATKWFYEAGRNFYWQNEHRIAVDLLTRARDLNQELNRDHAPTRWYLADAWRMNSYRLKPPYIDEGTVKKGLAISIWESGIEIEMPSSDDSWVYISRALMSEQQALLPDAAGRRELWWEAAAYLERAILLDEADALRWAYLGRYQRLLENESNALEATEKALGYDPDSGVHEY